MEDSIDSLDTVAFAQALARAASDTQATDIVILDLRGLVSYTDGFVLCSGKNRRHVTAIAEAVRMEAKRGYGIAPLGVEGKERGQWVLVDFGDIVVHVFDASMRGFYDLDGLWRDAPRIEGPPAEEPSEPTYFNG
ncbi:MAG: ribosome silencing factor [Alphaproteobacteria bacterium]|nr:ribosome silencing factor [Alphaproteobacteria bacterium]